MDDDIEAAVPEIIDPAQAAWAQYVSARYLHRDVIQVAHAAYLAGWNERDRSAKAAIAFKQGIIDDLSADVKRLEDE